MERRTVKKLNLSLFIACLIGGIVGYILAEMIYGYTRTEWPAVLATGVYFLVLAFFIILFGLISEIITHHMRCESWSGRQVGIGLLMTVLFSLACLVAGIVFQFLYGLGMNVKTLSNIQDYIILIDNSGSTSSTDPDEERFSSVLDMVATLNESNNVSVKVFCDVVEGTFPMEAVTPDMQTRLRAFFDQFDCDGGTDIQGVLMEAIDEYTPDGRNAAVLLLSDGESSVDIDALTDAYTAKNMPIYCLGFSGSGFGGSALLENIASATDGYYYEIDELSNLTQAVDKMVTLANRRMLLNARRGSDRSNMLATVLRIVFLALLGVLTGIGTALALDSMVVLTKGMILHTVGAVLAGIVTEFGLQAFLPDVFVRLLMCILMSLMLVPYLKTVASDSGSSSGGSGKERTAAPRRSRGGDGEAKDLRKRKEAPSEEKTLI